MAETVGPMAPFPVVSARELGRRSRIQGPRRSAARARAARRYSDLHTRWPARPAGKPRLRPRWLACRFRSPRPGSYCLPRQPPTALGRPSRFIVPAAVSIPLFRLLAKLSPYRTSDFRPFTPLAVLHWMATCRPFIYATTSDITPNRAPDRIPMGRRRGFRPVRKPTGLAIRNASTTPRASLRSWAQRPDTS